jgi:hypothetical protein
MQGVGNSVELLYHLRAVQNHIWIFTNLHVWFAAFNQNEMEIEHSCSSVVDPLEK